MNTNHFLPLYDFLNEIQDPVTPDEISAVSYSNMLDDISIAMIDYRMDHGMNQTQLAEFLSCSQSLVSSYESGARNISAEKLCELMAKIGKKVTITIEDATSDIPEIDPESIYPDSKIKNTITFDYATAS